MFHVRSVIAISLALGIAAAITAPLARAQEDPAAANPATRSRKPNAFRRGCPTRWMSMSGRGCACAGRSSA